MKQYEFQRFPFNLNVSPFLVQLVTREHISREVGDSEMAVDVIQNSTYMDDSMFSVESPEKTIKLKEELINLWRSAGMNTNKWVTNYPELLRTIEAENVSKNLNLGDKESKSIKTLGVIWNASNDEFGFIEDVFGALKKRKFLGVFARSFDPLGLLGKIILHDMWMKSKNGLTAG